MNSCPCGSKKDYTACCEVFIQKKASAPTPEALMRSRYTAYTQANMDYILRTMRPPASVGFEPLSAYQWAKSVCWLKLKVVSATKINSADTMTNNQGFVEFIAYFQENNKKQTIHELSEFHLIDSEWFYVDGKILK